MEAINRAARRQQQRAMPVERIIAGLRQELAAERNRIDKLFGRMVEYEQRLVELRQEVSPATIAKLIHESLGKERKDLLQLMGDNTALLRYQADCAECGEPVTYAGLNEVIRKRREADHAD